MSEPVSDPAPNRPGQLRVAGLPQARPTSFDLSPGAPERAALAETLDLLGLRKLRLSGTIRAEGARGWRLEAVLGATVVQPCVVTLAPVTTRLDVPVTRIYLPESDLPDSAFAPGDEVEMPEDDTLEPLTEVIDLSALMTEALALALPDYPRAEGAGMEPAVFAPPGAAPLRDEDTRPFAGLAALRGKLGGDPDDDPGT